MENYVLGFGFYEGRVLLINKLKPEWQKGRVNGIGGKINPGETARGAMVREFREETSVNTQGGGWRQFAVLAGNGFTVYCFSYGPSSELLKAKQVEEEKPCWHWHNCLPLNIIPNLSWLVPMAQDSQVTGIITDHTLPGEGTGIT